MKWPQPKFAPSRRARPSDSRSTADFVNTAGEKPFLPGCGFGDDRLSAYLQDELREKQKPETLFHVAAISALMLIHYVPVLVPMAKQWWTDPNYGHGFLVPFFAAYVFWRSRARVRAARVQPSNWGLAIAVFAIALLFAGRLASEHFTARASLVFLIGGLVVFLFGWPTLRSVRFPLGYLFFMIPLPAIVYFQLTFPLQLLASRLGAAGLVALGVPAVREGNLLILPNCTLEVVEACSGIRSMFSLFAAAAGYIYLAESSLSKRIAIVATAVPAAILSNALRLVFTGVISFRFGPEEISGSMHGALGLLFFAAAFLSIFWLHLALRHFAAKQVLEPAH